MKEIRDALRFSMIKKLVKVTSEDMLFNHVNYTGCLPSDEYLTGWFSKVPKGVAGKKLYALMASN